jgi:solute carrier family 25 iron transporter 28/37
MTVSLHERINLLVEQTRMQCLNPNPNANYRGIFDALVKIVRTEGAFRPVRGMSVVAFGAGPAHALYFSCYEFIKKNFSGASKPGDNPLVNGIHFMLSCIL